MGIRRFTVAGHSMVPTLQPGKELVASDTLTPHPGDVVVFEHPRKTGRWLVKRLRDTRGHVYGDNSADSGEDSATFGPIDITRAYTMVERLDAKRFVEATEMLGAEDPALNAVIEHFGVPEFWQRRPGFETLVLLILEQQVSLESGAAMYRRLLDLAGAVTPQSLDAAGNDALRSIGVTRQKAEYLLGLAKAVINGELDFDEIEASTVETSRSRLTALKGIGSWTADAYLLSAGRRPDMWPVGDRALQVGAAEVLGMNTVPDQDQLEILGEPWRPVRAVAARLIWHAYLTTRGRVEPPDPTLRQGTDQDA